MKMSNFNTALEAYTECALWASYDDDNGIELSSLPLDKSVKIAFEDNVAKFFTMPEVQSILNHSLSNFNSLDEMYRQAGIALFLNHNGHGSGFWDYPELWGYSGSEKLSTLSELIRGIDVYIGDDNRVYSI